MKTQRLIVAAALAALPLGLTACADREETVAADPGESAVINVYSTRGQVTQIPTTTEPDADFLVRHEPIPAFKANANETEPTGMNAMIMPFPLGDGVTLDDIEVGDKIRLEFMVQYDPETGDPIGWEAVLVEELGPDAKLVFTHLPTESADIDASEADWLTGQGGDEPAFQEEPGAEPGEEPEGQTPRESPEQGG